MHRLELLVALGAGSSGGQRLMELRLKRGCRTVGELPIVGSAMGASDDRIRGEKCEVGGGAEEDGGEGGGAGKRGIEEKKGKRK
jgi:hypothetical protein